MSSKLYANSSVTMSNKSASSTVLSSEPIRILKKAINKRHMLGEFLKEHSIPKEKSGEIAQTNTRIGDKDANIYGGSYHISNEDYPQFLELLYSHIFEKNNLEYLTEKQILNEGPILVDLDLRFGLDVETRQYTIDHIGDLLDNYVNVLNHIFQFDESTQFPIYVMEKDEMNRLPGKGIVKDGIHLIIGIQCDHVTQQIIRKKMIDVLTDTWSDMPITNTWDDVLDSAISCGHNNWQMYGSRKPHHEPYKLTHIYNVTYDADDNEPIRKEIPISKFDIKKNFPQLSARYRNHPYFFYKPDFAALREKEIENGSVEVPGETRRSPQRQSANNAFVDMNAGPSINILNVRNAADLKRCVDETLDQLQTQFVDYELIEAYHYTMTLPNSYYGDGSYNRWIRVGWALRNISNRLFFVWIAFSAQYSKFEYNEIPTLYEKWLKFNMKDPNGLTKRSIMHWSKIDAREQYEGVRKNSMAYYVDLTLGSGDDKKSKSCSDFDLAVVLHQMFKDDYVCVSVKANLWYRYKNHRWEEIDSGTTLRKSISTDMRDLYRNRIYANMVVTARGNPAHSVTAGAPAEAQSDVVQNKSERVLDICSRLGRTTDKKNIMTEARDLFYDSVFFQRLDTNPYLLCFNNGVIDFKTKTFRRGYPEDYISKCTKIDYCPFDANRDKHTADQIYDFMNKLFPVRELHDYMWEHLASTLIGTAKRQTFNMYIGQGQNGKSVLVSLMELVLGDYKGDVPLSAVTDKRTKIGGLAPELVALKGIRYAVMQEPQKGDRINEGVMKQLTSGIDPIQARAPYMPQSITFIPQFKLVVCANYLMEIKSQDHGTWRRIRVVDFMSLFTDSPVVGDREKPHQFKIDLDIIDKFEQWKEIFAALLVQKAFETGGDVRDCPIVLKSSKSYRESQDYIAEFISDRIIEDPAGTISKTELTQEFTNWYSGVYGNRGGPNPKDVQEYMDKRFGNHSKYKCWRGCRIAYENTINSSSSEEEEDDDNDIDVNELCK